MFEQVTDKEKAMIRKLNGNSCNWSIRAGWAVLFVLCVSAQAAVVRGAELIPLRAGPVSMVFDAENVFLRYLRVGPHEVLRGINAPIRNENWATIAPQVSNLQVVQEEDSFRVTFDVACVRDEIDFHWRGMITGSAEGEVIFSFDGEARATFRKNRIGFCVLHGPGAAGQPWTLESVDGRILEGAFPQLISAHQPAKNLRAITHRVADGIHARVAFEGDIFEMEDQRNWTDASFKTYCTPLEIPYPVELAKGARITQKITIQLQGEAAAVESATNEVVLTVGNMERPLPRLGLQLSSEVRDLSAQQLDRLKTLNMDHLYVDLALSAAGFVEQLRRASEQAGQLGTSLHVVLGPGETPDYEGLAAAVREISPPVHCWLIRGGDPQAYTAARKALTAVAGEAKIGVTRVTNFVELNRARPEDRSIEAVGFAINPQIHAFDDASMIETLPIHADAVLSARAFCGDRPLMIGPMTMAPQLLDGEDQPGGPPLGGPLPTWVDPRQTQAITAAWTLGSISYLAAAGADSATFFETVGWAGVMDADSVPQDRPQEFPSRAGEVYPVYDLLREFADFRGGTVREFRTSDSLKAVALGLRKGDRARILFANLSAEPQQITLRGLAGRADIQVLGGEVVTTAAELRVTLPGYGIGRIDR